MRRARYARPARLPARPRARRRPPPGEGAGRPAPGGHRDRHPGGPRAGARRCCSSSPTRGEMPLAINVFGTERRMAMALGVDDARRDRRPDRRRCSSRSCRVGWSGIRDGARQGAAAASRCRRRRSRPRPARRSCYRGDEVDLDRLPGLQAWPDDGGVFLNFGLTHTKHPETGTRNLGLYRLQQHSPQHARHALADPQGLHRAPRGRRAARRAAAGRDRVRLPDPAVTYAASAPLPGDIDEYLFAGFLRGERVEMVDCLTVPLQVPAARADRARGLASSRASGCPRGRSATTPASTRRSSRSRCCTSSAMTMRTDPIYQSIIVGRAAAGGRADRQGHRADLPAADPAD